MVIALRLKWASLNSRYFCRELLLSSGICTERIHWTTAPQTYLTVLVCFIVPSYLVNMGAQLVREHKLWDSLGNIHPWLVVGGELFLWKWSCRWVSIMKECSSLWQREKKRNMHGCELAIDGRIRDFITLNFKAQIFIWFCFINSDLGFKEEFK